jgi:hypothetical protein
MEEERLRILGMLSEGKITVEEAGRLLAALQAPEGERMPSDAGAPPADSKLKPKYLRVQVSEPSGEKVNVRVPLGLLRAGIKLGALMPEEAKAKVKGKLGDKGFQLDMDSLKPENIEEFIEALSDLEVTVDEPGDDKVRIFCE